ncbi:hypothetical protein DPM33_32825 [Mesorhizobium hawassense]|uniref:DUF680 domain-containing protein n=1 Tax=Mesorhizobium hawassense TaxID=1209954 RepID=A0A330H9Y7_9HYPH|nr:DUF680 domain-containing protein [Mesorhizobium hawassense]RAZ83174.1 hypothetical protein DPM33_32825 [Mesorhizobium hawassense]
MTRIALTTAAMLLAMGSAFAGSDHYGDTNANQSTVGVDRGLTASVRKHDVAKSANVDTSMTTGSAMPDSFPPESGQGIWGN